MDDLGGRSRRRKRWAIRLVVVALVATVGIVVVSYVRRNFRRPKPRASVPALPKDVQRRLSGLTFTRSNGGQKVFTIHAESTLAYKTAAATVLSNVTVEFYGRQGERRDILRTHQATYYRSSGDFSAQTDVHLELNAPPGASAEGANSGKASSTAPAPGRSSRKPVFLNTSGVTYNYQKALLETSEPVQFQAGPLTGTAKGMSYATRDGWLELDKNIKAEMSPQEGSLAGNPIRLSASRLRFDKDAHQAELWGPIQLHQSDRSGSADHALIAFNNSNRVTSVKLDGAAKFHQLSPAGRMDLASDQIEGKLNPRNEQIESLDAIGHVRGKSLGRGKRGGFEAERLQLYFAESKPESGRATGNVRVDIFSSRLAETVAPKTAAAADGSHEQLTTNQLDFRLWPGCNALESASTLAGGKLTLFPRNSKEGDRTVTAGHFAFSFDSLSRLTKLVGNGGTRVESMPPAGSGKPSVPAVTTANELIAKFNPPAGTLLSVVQSGNFQFEQADDRARAEKAAYSALNDSLVLTGHPEAWNATTRTQANRVIIGVASGMTIGEGGVRVSRLDAKSPSSLPTNILADHATMNRHDQTAHYSGNVRAWHGADVIEASALEINRLKQTVRAGPSVVSSYMVSTPGNAAKVSGEHGKAASDPLTIRAKRLDYSVTERKATYEGNVSLRTQNTVMHTNRLEVLFAGSSSDSGSGADQGLQVERAVATGNVDVTQPGRRATGKRADYEAGSGKIVMTGGPPTLYDSARGVTSGRRLTFFTLNDRLLVDRGFNSTNPTIRNVAQ